MYSLAISHFCSLFLGLTHIQKLGRNHSACQGTFYRIRDQPEYKAILDAGEAYDESNDHEKEEEKGDKKDKKGNKKK